MCPDYREINKMTITNKFHIHVIYKLLDEMHGEVFFTKFDLQSRYHQIKMRKEEIPKILLRAQEAIIIFL